MTNLRAELTTGEDSLEGRSEFQPRFEEILYGYLKDEEGLGGDKLETSLEVTVQQALGQLREHTWQQYVIEDTRGLLSRKQVEDFYQQVIETDKGTLTHFVHQDREDTDNYIISFRGTRV